MSNITSATTAKFTAETISNNILCEGTKHLVVSTNSNCAGMLFDIETGADYTIIRLFDQSSNGLSSKKSLYIPASLSYTKGIKASGKR